MQYNKIKARQNKFVIKKKEVIMSQTKRKVEHTLHVVRYSVDELKDFITDMFYTHVATETKMYFMDKFKEQNAIRPRTRYELRKQRIEDIKFRIKDYKQRREAEPIQEDKEVYSDGIAILQEKLMLEENFDIKHQKAMYNKTGDLFATHTFTEMPLNKKICGIYDDFNAVVLYFDNLTNEEVISKLENAETLEEKRQIVKDNVEITHITLVMNNAARTTLVLEGKYDKNLGDPEDVSAQLLPAKYADFGTITLADIESIKNNDLAQIIQERIDMDAEDLEIESVMVIKGEEYKIMKSPYTGREYIRYVCPSTQRVYHNMLDFEYLSRSPYYVKGDVDSYIKSWYNISNLFLELTDEEIARPSISC